MIHYFAEFPKTLLNFVEDWAPELRPHVRTLSYGRIPFLGRLPAGACIFSDLERLPAWKRALGRHLTRRCAAAKEAPVILNDPTRFVRRYPLLKLLQERGINRFRVARIDDFAALKFPVFLRSEVDHRGAITDLLHTPAEVTRAVAGLPFPNSFRKRWLMLEEFLDCVNGDGLYRKYSALNIHGTLIPRHLLFSRHWVVKVQDVVSEETAQEEAEYLRTFPHRDEVLEVFRLAGIDYGRIDYGVMDGRIQVWEINTNPNLVPPRRKIDPRRMPGQEHSARRIAETFLTLARG